MSNIGSYLEEERLTSDLQLTAAWLGSAKPDVLVRIIRTCRSGSIGEVAEAIVRTSALPEVVQLAQRADAAAALTSPVLGFVQTLYGNYDPDSLTASDVQAVAGLFGYTVTERDANTLADIMRTAPASAETVLSLIQIAMAVVTVDVDQGVLGALDLMLEVGEAVAANADQVLPADAGNAERQPSRLEGR